MRFFYVTVVSLYYQIAVVLTPPAPHVLQECVVSMGNET